MISVINEGIILESRDGVEFESEGVLNPACIEKDGVIHMFYRAVAKGNYSSIGYCQIKNNKVIERWNKPIMAPEFDYEKGGMEDPRVTLLEGTYYMLYTAYDGINARIAYAISSDLLSWNKKGLLSPSITYDLAEDIFRESVKDRQRYMFFEKMFKALNNDGILLWEKDASLFPKKINGKYALIHRILPGIQLCFFDSFDDLKNTNYWVDYLKNLKENIVLDPKGEIETAYIGGGCVPIETNDGWLLIYHSVDVINGRKIYQAGAALLDLNNPQKVVGRLPYPLFSPEEEWEKKGAVNNVVFPTGTWVNGEKLYIYYGAADKKIAAKSLDISILLKQLKEKNE
jgi:beta-1,2-mannobiose phosphorylase / 1,2-beta-oligomannan phosphorylase